MFKDGQMQTAFKVDEKGNFNGALSLQTEGQTFNYKFNNLREFSQIFGKEDPKINDGLLVQDLYKHIEGCIEQEAEQLSEMLREQLRTDPQFKMCLVQSTMVSAMLRKHKEQIDQMKRDITEN